MRRIETLFSRVEMVPLWIFLVSIWVLTLTSSLGRSLFDASMTWAPEVSGGLLVYLVTMGISPAFADRGHTSVAILQRWWRPYEGWVDHLTRVATAIYAVILLRYGLQTALGQMQFHVTSPATGWPRWIFSLALPVGMVTTLIRVGILWPTERPEAVIPGEISGSC